MEPYPPATLEKSWLDGLRVSFLARQMLLHNLKELESVVRMISRGTAVRSVPNPAATHSQSALPVPFPRLAVSHPSFSPPAFLSPPFRFPLSPFLAPLSCSYSGSAPATRSRVVYGVAPAHPFLRCAPPALCPKELGRPRTLSAVRCPLSLHQPLTKNNCPKGIS